MNCVVFGANGGIGSAVTKILAASGYYEDVFAVSRTAMAISNTINLPIETFDDGELSRISRQIDDAGPLTLCIVSVGILSQGKELLPEKSLGQQSRAAFEKVFHANTVVPALIAKHILPVMPRNQPMIFAAMSARVGSISDNKLGGWHAYRASKAALNMLIKNYAIEQRQRNRQAAIVGLHPGTVDTGLSRPFQRNVPAGQLSSPDQAAAKLLNVIENLRPEDSGKVFDWAGAEIPA